MDIQPEVSAKDPGENLPQEPQAIDSETLLRGRKVAIIRHNGEDYRLILTRNDRLILQK